MNILINFANNRKWKKTIVRRLSAGRTDPGGDELSTLYNFTKFVASRHPNAVSTKTAVTLLIAFAQELRNNNFNDKLDARKGKWWIWYRGNIYATQHDHNPQKCYRIEPPTLVKFCKYIAKLQPLKNFETFGKIQKKDPTATTLTPAEEDEDRNPFERLIPQDIGRTNRRKILKQIGPCRIATSGTLQVPWQIYMPVPFELVESCDIHAALEKLLVQFMDQIAIYLKNASINASLVCCLSMYIATMVHGNKLTPKNGSLPKSIYRAYGTLAETMAKLIIESPNASHLSHRSLAYFAASQVCGGHVKATLEHIARLLLERQHEPIDADHVENFTYSFSKSYIQDEDIYKLLARQALHGAPSHVVYNIKRSFERVKYSHLLDIN